MHRLFSQLPITDTEAQNMLLQTFTNASSLQKAIFLAASSAKPLDWEHWLGFYAAFRHHAQPLPLLSSSPTYDWITPRHLPPHSTARSLAIALVAAAAGVPVLKWGDYGYGSSTGYSDIFEYMGAPLQHNPQRAQQQLEICNFAYLHAPSFYPDLLPFAEARREITIPSWLDTLLPLLHPCPSTQVLIATPSIELVSFYQYWFLQHQIPFFLLHDFSGSAEISLTDNFKFITATSEQTVHLADWEIPSLAAPAPVSAPHSPVLEARQLWKILTESAPDAEMATVIINAAWWIYHVRQHDQFNGAIAEAEAALSSGRALECLEWSIES